MIQATTILFCDNEHGDGDRTFPDLKELDAYSLCQLFVNGKQRASQIRKDAKEAGWGRVSGGDYCPDCMNGGI